MELSTTELSPAAVASLVAQRLEHNGSQQDHRALVTAAVEELEPGTGHIARAALIDAAIAELAGLGPLQYLVDDPTASDIMVNGANKVFVERDGRIESVDIELDASTIRLLIDRVIGPLGLRIDRSSPGVDARLPGGARLHALLPPIAVDGPYLTIRRPSIKRLSIESFTDDLTVSYLTTAVQNRRTILVTGATGAGKTTLLNALASALSTSERIITIEDAAELSLMHPHVIRLESRPAGADGFGAVTVRDLVRHALRMRPDRFVIGEVRGAEALDMIAALLTGHAGSMATLHANSAADGLLRLETMAMSAGLGLPLAALQRQIAAAIDLIVHVSRVGDRRCITEICEVRQADGLAVLEPVTTHLREELLVAGSSERSHDSSVEPTELT
jgi:pilus assembly protein CpaF